jgi:hypothetical protein
MKNTRMTQKSTQTTVPNVSPEFSTNPNRIAITPPAYGMDVVDHQLIQAAPEHGQEQQPLESVTLPAWAGVIQRKEAWPGAELQKNRTGLPDNLKAGIERLSGMPIDDVRVHYNSAKPAQLQALAYTQGTDIHVGPGQERHLPHEAWHVVQQKQGRVKPTIQMIGGVSVNDDQSLEHEANSMGARALGSRANVQLKAASQAQPANTIKGCSCYICQSGGRHVSRSPLSPANLIQARQIQHQTGSPIYGPAAIQRMAIPDGDPNPAVTAVLRAIENAAAAPAYQTINNANDVVAAAQAPVLPDPGTEETFGLARYNDGLFALGSQEFATAAGATRLGARAPREHAEISFISNRGVPNRVWTTQDCCLFCFGYLDTQHIPHLPLRTNPFPQAWTHPTGGWQIVRRRIYGRKPHWVISAPDGTTSTYLPAPPPAPKKTTTSKRKKAGDGEGGPKKKTRRKRTGTGSSAKKRIKG